MNLRLSLVAADDCAGTSGGGRAAATETSPHFSQTPISWHRQPDGFDRRRCGWLGRIRLRDQGVIRPRFPAARMNGVRLRLVLWLAVSGSRRLRA